MTSLAPLGVALAVAVAVGFGAGVVAALLGAALGGDSLPLGQPHRARHSRGRNERGYIENS